MSDYTDRIERFAGDAEDRRCVAEAARALVASDEPLSPGVLMGRVDALYRLVTGEDLSSLQQLARVAVAAGEDFGPLLGMNPKQHHPGNIIAAAVSTLRDLQGKGGAAEWKDSAGVDLAVGDLVYSNPEGGGAIGRAYVRRFLPEGKVEIQWPNPSAVARPIVESRSLRKLSEEGYARDMEGQPLSAGDQVTTRYGGDTRTGLVGKILSGGQVEVSLAENGVIEVAANTVRLVRTEEAG